MFKEILRKSLLISLFVLLFSFVFSVSTFSHGSGESIKKQVGDHRLILEYDPITLVAGESTPLTFEIEDQSGKEPDFTDVWVRITSNGEVTAFAGGIAKASLGATRMTFTFPREDEYTISTRFQNEGETIAEAEFPLTIEGGEGATRATSATTSSLLAPQTVVGAIAGLVVGFMATLAIRPRGQKAKRKEE